MGPALLSKALQSAGVFHVLGIALGTCLVLGYSSYFGKQWLPYLQESLGTPPTLGSSGYPTCRRRAVSGGSSDPGQSNHCGSWAGVFLSVCPLLQPLHLGLFGVVAGQVPCSAVFRVAISLGIWSPSSFEPSITSVTADDLAQTFSLASSISLLAFLAATMSWEYVVSGLLCRYLIESLMCLHTPWKSQSLRWHATSQSAILLGQLSQIWFKVPSCLVAKEGTFLWLPWVTLLKFCIRTLKDATVPKITVFVKFLRYWQ